MIKETVEIQNKLGLHARASARLVKAASKYACKIEVEYDEKIANAKSIMGIMMLAAGRGCTITLRTDGEDETEAMTAIKSLIENRFGETE